MTVREYLIRTCAIAIIILISTFCYAHPGIGIVCDSRDNIFYSDLANVYKISNGRTSIAVANVHTHELYLDENDILYGEHVSYQPGTEKFYHYLWRLTPDGDLDTVVDLSQAYIKHDFSLARDRQGNEYYLRLKDTQRLYKRDVSGRENVFATGNFAGIKWLHPQHDGSLLLVSDNNVLRITATGSTVVLARNIGNSKPSFAFCEDNITIWGAWEDHNRNVYVAVFSDQAIKQITPKGEVSVRYTSTGKWSPTHGVFDKKGKLWVLECSDKNEIRVVLAPS